ncbi:unnamed protein product [Medioppia subpectinata]|uniref:Uncharacterized protein n=1 Tax=Medioppia subpectinata TaxID=1979941 RepID=A0A7R9KGT4_9ACAR|nr:unnamed protein product [Medioppia subpectinata]CAG2102059.1 unnamed protein product [Medioppia subpectinata]
MAWIEEQKIRHYKIEDRAVLRDVDHKDWDTAFHQYLSDISCPFPSSELNLVLDWIITTAITFEYRDNFEKYKNFGEDNGKQVVTANPIDGLDFDSNEFKEGVKQLAEVLKVPIHATNHLITLTAISLVIKNHISMEDKEKREEKRNLKTDRNVLKTGLDDNSMPLKMRSNDRVLTNCAKVVRLLYVNDLRELQTKVNEMIASIQSITANPKTDTSLGKVGVK